MIGNAQHFNKLNPFIEKQGNVGSVDDFKSFAAQRYVELRMGSFTKDTYADETNREYLPMQDNYDKSRVEPVLLPSKFPVILNSGIMGIASGFASGIPTHSVSDICKLTIRFIDEIISGKELSDKALIADFRPDFPMGAIITNEAEIVDMYINGTGVIRMNSVIDEGVYQGKPVLIVRELPYKVSTSSVMQKIQELCGNDPRTKKPLVLQDKIADMKDLSSAKSNNPVELVIVPKKDISLGVLKNVLLQNTQLGSTINYQPNVLLGNELVENASIRQILGGWLQFRESTLSRRFSHEIHRAAKARALKEALIKAHGSIDKVIDAIKKASSKEDASLKVQKLLKLTKQESDYIVSIQLYQIAKLEVSKLKDEITTLSENIDKNMAYLSDRTALLGLISEQLAGMAKKYKEPRRSKLTNVASGDFDVRSVIESEDLIIGISTDNYVYAKPVSEMREYVQRGAKGSNFIDKKYKRVIRDMMVVNSHDDLFIFTDQGKVVEAKGFEFNVWNSPISNILPTITGQNVVAVVKAHRENDQEKYFTFITKNSIMKHVTVAEMICHRKMEGGNIAIVIDKGDELVNVQLLDDLEGRIVITSNMGRCQNLAATDIAPAKRPTRGFPKATLNEGEYIKCMTVIPADEVDSALILVASTRGVGKVTPLSDIPARRGDSGKRSLIKLITFKGANDTLVCGLKVNEGDSLIATTAANKTNKFSTDLVNSQSRTAMGVRLVTLEEGDSVTNISLA